MIAGKTLRVIATFAMLLFATPPQAFDLPRSFASLDEFWKTALKSPPIEAYEQGLQQEHLFQEDKDILPPDIEARLSAREIAVNLYINRAAGYQEAVPPEDASEDERREIFAKTQDNLAVLFKRHNAAHVELFLLNIVRASQSSERSSKCYYLRAAEASLASFLTNANDAPALRAMLPETWQPLAKVAFDARSAHEDTLNEKTFCVQAERVDRNAAITIIQKVVNAQVIAKIEEQVTGDGGLVKGVADSQNSLDDMQDRVEGIDPKAGTLSSLHRDMANRLGNLEFVSTDALGLAEIVQKIETMDFAAMIESQASVPRNSKGEVDFSKLKDLQPLIDVRTAKDETYKSMKALVEGLADVATIPPSHEKKILESLAVCKDLPSAVEKLQQASTGDRDEAAEELRVGFRRCVTGMESYVASFTSAGDMSLNLYGGAFAEDLRQLSTAIINLNEQE